MFCQKCGYKLIEGAEKCSNCGAVASASQICGGFWGLVSNNNPQVNQVKTIENTTTVRRPINQNNSSIEKGRTGMNPVNKPSKMDIVFRILTIICLVIAIIALSINIILFLKIRKIESDTKNLNTTVSDYMANETKEKIKEKDKKDDVEDSNEEKKTETQDATANDSQEKIKDSDTTEKEATTEE